MEWVDFWITGALKKKIWFFLTTEFEFKEDDPPRYIFADKKRFCFCYKKNKEQHDYSFC